MIGLYCQLAGGGGILCRHTQFVMPRPHLGGGGITNCYVIIKRWYCLTSVWRLSRASEHRAWGILWRPAAYSLLMYIFFFNLKFIKFIITICAVISLFYLLSVFITVWIIGLMQINRGLIYNNFNQNLFALLSRFCLLSLMCRRHHDTGGRKRSARCTSNNTTESRQQSRCSSIHISNSCRHCHIAIVIQ